MCTQGLKETVDAIAGEAKDSVDSPLNEPLNDKIGNLFCHCFSPSDDRLAAKATNTDS
jgi:hypothetical protein